MKIFILLYREYSHYCTCSSKNGLEVLHQLLFFQSFFRSEPRIPLENPPIFSLNIKYFPNRFSSWKIQVELTQEMIVVRDKSHTRTEYITIFQGISIKVFLDRSVILFSTLASSGVCSRVVIIVQP